VNVLWYQGVQKIGLGLYNVYLNSR